MMKLQVLSEALNKVNFLRKLEDMLINKYSTLGIILFFSFVNVVAAFAIYLVIPVASQYNTNIADGKDLWHDADYTWGFLFCVLVYMAVYTIILLLALKDINESRALHLTEDTNGLYLKKFINVPFIIYFIQVFLPILILFIYSLLRNKPVEYVFELSVIIFSFSTLLGAFSLASSRRILTKSLLLTGKAGRSFDKIRFGMRSKVTLQVLPVIIATIILSLTTGYSFKIIACYILLITVNIFVIYYIPKSIMGEIKKVVEGLNKIVEGSNVEIEENKRLCSNDEIGDLVSAFSKVRELDKVRVKMIEENRKRLAEKERLANLGAMIGGITHNLRSPIMSISGAVEGLKDLINEYEESINDSKVTKDDHYEIAKEMMSWVEKIKPQCAYMSDIVSAVKGQAAQMNSSAVKSFTLEDLLKRVDILMNHELRTFRCKLNKDIQIDPGFEITGEINNLIQVLNNLITNAIHSYEGKEGIINLRIMKSKNYVEFIIEDFGKGIPTELQNKLFKEMVTTKGENGTGLGLYMSYSTIKEFFKGDMRFESKEGKGTVFHVIIPENSSNAEIKGGIK